MPKTIRIPNVDRSFQKVLARFDEVWDRLGAQNADLSEEEIAEDIAAARAELSRDEGGPALGTVS